MYKILLPLMLLSTLSLSAAPPPKPSDFPTVAHVVYSRGGGGQEIDAMIDGQPVELGSYTSVLGILKLGDYPARISAKAKAPDYAGAYDLFEAYDFLMPDGKIRTYTVLAIGTPPAGLSLGSH